MFSTKNKTKIYKGVLVLFNIRKKGFSDKSAQLAEFYSQRQNISSNRKRIVRVLERLNDTIYGDKDVVTIHKSDLEVLYWASTSNCAVASNLIQSLDDEIEKLEYTK